MKTSQFAPKLVALCAMAWATCLPAAAQPAGPEGTPGMNLTADYVIGVEDELQVVVWGEKDLTLKVQVRPDGKITLPLVNDVVVAGRTSEQVRQQLARLLATFVREPNVTVIVTGLNSYRVYFLGELRRPGAINFFRPTRLLQGIAASGGATEYANTIVVLREEEGREKRIELDYKKLLAGTQENFYLMAGDTVVVR